MKSLFFVLMIANLAAGAWLLLQAPVGVVREPGRMDLQLEQGRVRVLGEAEVARLRQKAESDAAANAAASVPAPGAAPASAPGASAAPAAAVAVAASTAAVELPLASCIDIGPFASEAATRRIRTRLAAAGLADRVSTSTTDKITRLRLTGVDAAGESLVHLALRDFPKQEMNHCSEAPPAR